MDAAVDAIMITDRLYRSLRRWPAAQRLCSRVVRRLPHRQRLIRHLGLLLLVDPSDLSGFYLYYEKQYDDDIFRFLQTHLPSFTWAIDLGANIGLYTAFMALFCDSVDAFEPDKEIAKKLEQNLRLNRIENVTIHRKCVSDHTGVVYFEVSPSRNLGIGRIGEQGIPLPSIDFGDFLSRSEPRALFIKMDIEGSEWLALKGATSALRSWKYPLAILMEIHPNDIARFGGTVPGLLALLQNIDLTVYALENGMLRPPVASARFWWVTNEQKTRSLNPHVV